MPLADHFPRTATAYPQLVNWAAPFDWHYPMAAAAIDVLSEELIAEQAQGRPAFLTLATLLREDLTDFLRIKMRGECACGIAHGTDRPTI